MTSLPTSGEIGVHLTLSGTVMLIQSSFRCKMTFQGRSQGGATGACAPPFSKKKKKNLHLVKKYNMNKQNFALTFLGKFIY